MALGPLGILSDGMERTLLIAGATEKRIIQIAFNYMIDLSSITAVHSLINQEAFPVEMLSFKFIAKRVIG